MAETRDLPPRTAVLEIEDALAYARASGDMNPLHFDWDHAAEHSPTGRPIAHGMYTMSLVWAWLDGELPGPVEEIRTEFRAPWSVGETVTFQATVRPDPAGAGRLRVDYEVLGEAGGDAPLAAGHAVAGAEAS